MLSFSAKTKNELCRAGLGNACCQTAELYGMLLFGTAFSNREIRFVTAQSAVMRRSVTLCKRVCSIEVQPALQGKRRVLQITEPACIALVMDKLGYDFKSYITYHLNRNLVDNECCVPAFLRGIFLAAGSIASPEKKCHLEIKIGHVILGREVMSLLLDANMTPKMAERRTSWLLYWKGAGQI